MSRNKVGKQGRERAMSLQEELPLLLERVHEIGERLDRLNRRIRKMQKGRGSPSLVAVVDSGKCIGCGRCETACPARAVSIENTPLVNPARCIGCGRCVSECRQGAITLQPVTFGRECKGGAAPKRPWRPT